jgi:DNA-binding transcriptional ArsR family regulator
MQNNSTSTSNPKSSSSSTQGSETPNWTAKNPGDELHSCLPKLSQRLSVVYKSPLPPGEKFLLGYLAWRVDAKSGLTWVSVNRMERETGISKSTLKRRLKRLTKSGWIDRRRRSNKSTVTTLLPEAFFKSEPEDGGSNNCSPTVSKEPPPSKPQRTHGRTTEDFPKVQSEPLSGTPSGEISGNKSSAYDDVIEFCGNLFEELQAEKAPYLTWNQYTWMLTQIKSRVKTIPRSPAYWRTCVEA